jgi:hypothetical protein
MPNKFAAGKHSIAECDRCGQRYKLHQLKTQTLKTKPYRVKVCSTCWDPDHPQLQLGMYPVSDPQGVENHAQMYLIIRQELQVYILTQMLVMQ